MSFPHPFKAAGLVAIGMILVACGKGDTEVGRGPNPGPPPIPITLNTVRTMELQRSVRIVGSLTGLETTTLSNRVAGRVSRIHVERGDRVKPNQKLLEIEPDRFQMAQREAEAALQQTLARLGVTEVPGPDFDVNQTAPVKKARSTYDNARAKLDRAEPLHQSKIMNDFEYLDILSTFRSAESALENSRDEARALLAQARQNAAQLDLRRKDSADSQILAPDGRMPDLTPIDNYVVTDRKISVGEYLREGTPLFTLVVDGTLKLQARVPERHLDEVRLGAQVTFQVEAYPQEEFAGEVSIIDPAVDPASRTFLIEARVDNGHYHNRLRPGSFVTGAILTRKEPNRIMVPLDAVSSFVGVTRVYTLVPQSTPPRVKAVNVKLGQQQELKDATGQGMPWVEILGGDLTPGDQVAVGGVSKLVDGGTVIVDTPQDAPAAAAAHHP